MSKAEAEKRAKALDHLNRLLKEHPGMDKVKAIEQTAVKFDLSPLEEDWLLRQLTESSKSEIRNPKET
ncbi:MAG TPA: hypothetical protein VL486_11325 [Verrucomicrobiae bacterium]|nr:hypothetical protein [Verrucomicrobiae bacterium]